MLLEAIFGIIAISVVFCCCTFCCYIVFHFIFTEEKSDVPTDNEVFEAKHYYDPLPLSTPSPPDTIFKPTPYTFKLQNGNGVYTSGFNFPHAVINPAVLQYPPGHVLEQQRVLPAQSKSQSHGQSTKQSKSDREYSKKQNSNLSRRRSRSRSPSPSPRRPKNVWSTNTEFQNPNHYYQQYLFHNQRHNHHNHHQQQQQQQQHHHQQQNSHNSPQSQQYQKEFQRQYVQLTQEHYPVHQKHIHFPPEGYVRKKESVENDVRVQHHQLVQYEPFMASSHATNVYTQQQHIPRQKESSKDHHSKSKSRHKEAVT